MKKLIAKWFCPSAPKLALFAAENVAKAVNESRAETKNKISRIAIHAAEITTLANRLSKMCEDGSIDEAEVKTLQDMFTPIMETALNYAFNW